MLTKSFYSKCSEFYSRTQSLSILSEPKQGPHAEFVGASNKGMIFTTVSLIGLIIATLFQAFLAAGDRMMRPLDPEVSIGEPPIEGNSLAIELQLLPKMTEGSMCFQSVSRAVGFL